MYIVISYDVATSTKPGQKRLRRIARICESYGQRVQNSVFECQIPSALFVSVREKLVKEMNMEEDSLRFYFLGKEAGARVVHLGAKKTFDIDGTLLL